MEEFSQPYYTRCLVVALPEAAMLTPQTHEGTMEAYAKPASPPPPSPGVVGGVVGGVPGGAIGGPVMRSKTKSGTNTYSYDDVARLNAPTPATIEEAEEREVAGASGQDL